MRNLEIKYNKIEQTVNFLKTYQPPLDSINDYLISLDTPALLQKVSFEKILLRPQVKLFDLLSRFTNITSFLKTIQANTEEIESAEISIKYAHYIEKESEIAQKMEHLDHIKIPPTIDYFSFSSLSMEAREKLTKVKPQNLGQASRISGVSPSDIVVLMIALS
jgi:tRNA uridine 5-carboxymethylaminomethyl modification enzyme